ncbi:MAG TPA: hypothetical protein VIF62_37540 [Labilithrix sp.]
MRFAIALSILVFPAVAYAADPNDSTPSPRERDVRDAAPVVAYAYGVHGTTAGAMGAQIYGLGLAAPGQRAIGGGGGTVWGSPLERLVLAFDGARDVFGNFAPSAAAIVRLVGRADDGWSLGALGKFKIEGFGVGPNDEIESEIESGLLLSYARYGWHLDANAIGGVGLGDDGEIDTEGRLRFGRDFGRWFRLGADGQARMRVSGATKLIGGRTWDFAAGPQAIASFGSFFGALTGGPATMGVARDAGWTAIASFGAAL